MLKRHYQIIRKTVLSSSALWHYRLWSFKTRDTKLERFLPKNQPTIRKLLNFENWTNTEVRFDSFFSGGFTTMAVINKGNWQNASLCTGA